MLDTNTIIRLVVGLDDRVRARAALCDADELVTSAIALAEVAYGSSLGKPPRFDKLQAFLEEVPVLDFDHRAAHVYATLPFRRGSYDRLIAAHALSLGLTVVTENEADFADVPGLRVENWTA
jgi:tRNA(fMet)-specific endonuclease VapC